MTRKNLAYFAISNSPGTSGNLTVSTAVDALHVTLGTGDDGKVYSTRIFETGVGSEIRTGCTYTDGTTTLTRGTLETSTTGSALNFTSAAKVQIVSSAADFDNYDTIVRSGFSALADGTNTQNLTTGTGTTIINGGGSGALRTEEFDIEGWFDKSTGIFYPQEAGLWLIGASAVIDSISDSKYMAVYIAHSTDGATWNVNDNKSCLAWRGASSSTTLTIGGSGSFIVSSDGTSDRWSLQVFHNDVGTPKIPGAAINRSWARFWARRIGEA